MKTKTSKLSEAQTAHLAAAIASREFNAATQRADLARVMFKQARKAYKQARKAAKRAAKRAKQAHKKFSPLAKFLKASKPKPARKLEAKPPKLKSKPTAIRRLRARPIPAVKAPSPEARSATLTDSNRATPPGD